MEGINIEQYECRGEYIEKVCEFVRNLSIAEIVIAVPDKKDKHYKEIYIFAGSDDVMPYIDCKGKRERKLNVTKKEI